MDITRKTVILVGTFLLASGFSDVRAQFARPPIGGGGQTRPAGPRPKKAAVIRQVQTVVKTKTVNVRSSSLAITTEKGANVVLTMLGPKGTKIPLPPKVAGDAGSVAFEDLKPGKYEASSSKDGFETAQTKTPLTIEPKTVHGLDLDLTPVKYKLKIKTNVTKGDILFAKAKILTENADGSITSEPLGNYCVTGIKPNGEAEITELERGYYEIDIRPSLEFEKRLTGVKIPDGLDDDDTNQEAQVFQVKLESQLSTEEFSPTAWIPADWKMPSTWQLDKGMKVRNAEGVALPQNDLYRYYRYFNLIAHVKVPDEGSIGIVLRAVDDKNFYVLQISGPRAPEQNAATLYVVKDSVKTAIGTQTIEQFEKTISSDSGFRIFISNDKDENFKVHIKGNDGIKHWLGEFRDPQPTYPKGAVGLWASPRSSFDVTYFIVNCTLPCK